MFISFLQRNKFCLNYLLCYLKKWLSYNLKICCCSMFSYVYIAIVLFAITVRPFRALRSASPLVDLHTGSLRQYNKAIWAVCIVEIRATVVCTCYVIHSRLEQYLKNASPLVCRILAYQWGRSSPPLPPLIYFLHSWTFSWSMNLILDALKEKHSITLLHICSIRLWK